AVRRRHRQGVDCREDEEHTYERGGHGAEVVDRGFPFLDIDPVEPARVLDSDIAGDRGLPFQDRTPRAPIRPTGDQDEVVPATGDFRAQRGDRCDQAVLTATVPFVNSNDLLVGDLCGAGDPHLDLVSQLQALVLCVSGTDGDTFPRVHSGEVPSYLAQVQDSARFTVDEGQACRLARTIGFLAAGRPYMGPGLPEPG